MDTKGEFYIGKVYDPKKGETTDEILLYDPDDLTTHAVVVGMTGSGKTGLCIDLLEEAALNNIPALLIDPKGDITNELLHFPDLLPSDFQPWVNPDQARREDKTVEQVSEEVASLWKNGLQKWGIDGKRLEALRDSAQFAVYSPGSNAGIPVSILATLEAPEIPWEGNQELLREKISSTVTALLGLVGFSDIDPVQSREHILLANIFESAWQKGKDLDLGELILQTQTPPFSKLGVIDIDSFFPQKDRFGLSMTLNNILAAPAFQSWIEGQPLDIPQLLFDPKGRPRHSVFYIAHLNDEERMFFVTLLFSAIETWMRTQGGTSSLRSIVYFDEIFGYLPPVSNPPSKEPMLRMLKQARAFGVGLVLVTQNPVDLDYKALSNAGSWFIGKLQTEKDKERLLDGLHGAMSGKLDRSGYDRLISTLGKRVFLLHNVHNPPSKAGQLFQTRWAMNYLAGPLTRAQIPPLNELAGASSPVISPSTREDPVAQPEKTTAVRESKPGKATVSGSTTRPSIPGDVREYVLPNNLTFTQAFEGAGRTPSSEAQSLGLVYRPVIAAQAMVRFLNRKYNLDFDQQIATLVIEPDRRGVVRWEEHPSPALDSRSLEAKPDPRARYETLEAPFSDAKILNSLEKDFLDWVYRSSEVAVRANETLKVYAGPDVSSGEFRKMCSEAARDKMDTEIDKVSASYDKKIDTLEDRMKREERELAEDQAEHSQRKMEELGTHAETIIGLFSKRRRSVSSSMSKRRMTSKAKADVEESLDAIEDYKKQIADLEKEKAEEIEEIKERWSDIVDDSSEITVTPYKKDVILDLFGVAWMPYHLIQEGKEKFDLPAYTGK